MGNGFWILVWDAWGSGLDMVNPRLLEVDGHNWWPYEGDEERHARVAELTAGLRYYKVIE